MEAKELLLDLIQIHSPSSEEEAIAQYISGLLNDWGITHKLVHISGKSYNIVINDIYKPKIVIATHLDTVEIDVPLRVISDREISGLGACDAKGSIASLLLAIKYMDSIPNDISFCFFSDEEKSGAGSSQYLMTHKPSSGLILEPTELNVCIEGYGAVEGLIVFKTRKMHPSIAYKLRKDNVIEKSIEILQKIKKEFMNIGMEFIVFSINAGNRNQYWIPDTCEVSFDIAIPYPKTPRICIELLSKLAEKYGFRFNISEYSPPFKTNDKSFIDKLRKAYSLVFNTSPKLTYMPSWTDANNFARAGIPVAVFGPGSLLYAHTDNEKIDLGEVIMASRYIISLVGLFHH